MQEATEAKKPTCKEMQEKLKEIYGIDEPLFIIRAQDTLSVIAIDDYINWAVHSECSDEFIYSLNQIAGEFGDWQTANPDRVKTPD